jgi:hypothetical protein
MSRARRGLNFSGVPWGMQTSAPASDVVTRLVPGGSADLAHLSDTELLSNTRILVGKSNQVFAALLAHLAEVDARGLHRTRACASLYTYCIYELRFSEDAAARRVGATKLVKRFPLLLDAIANGELHLTGLLMLGPHLTAENVIEVLGRAKFRTKKELAKLVRELHPLPLVPDSVEPLGLTPKPLRRPTWEQYVTSLAPPVRELPNGERPRDWANDTTEEDLSLVIGVGLAQARGAQRGSADGEALYGPRVVGPHVVVPADVPHVDGPHVDGPHVDGPHVDVPHMAGSYVGGSYVGGSYVGGSYVDGQLAAGLLAAGSLSDNRPLPPQAVSPASALPAPARANLWQASPRPLAPQQYQMQFTTSEEHVQLVERAKALLARFAPGQSLGELHLQAMKLLVAELEKKKFAVAARPSRRLTMGTPASCGRDGEGVREGEGESDRSCQGARASASAGVRLRDDGEGLRGDDGDGAGEGQRDRQRDSGRAGVRVRDENGRRAGDRASAGMGVRDGEGDAEGNGECESEPDSQVEGGRVRDGEGVRVDDSKRGRGRVSVASAGMRVRDDVSKREGDRASAGERVREDEGAGGVRDDNEGVGGVRDDNEGVGGVRDDDEGVGGEVDVGKGEVDGPRWNEMVDCEDGLDFGRGARGRSRHIPAAVRRAVFERDGGCCTFVDERGVRCRETRGLELHHRQPFGKQGTHSASNVTLYCRAHNTLAAERDFGAPHMARHREALRHETLVSELRAANHLSCERD